MPACMSAQPLLKILKKLSGPSARAAAAPATAFGFATQGRLPAQGLKVDVEGLAGPLGPACSAAQALALQQLSHPAKFGRRSDTLLDATVRDTGEISADALSLSWTEGAFQALQAEIASALGLDGVALHAHNLLVYGPGQFFKPHQDTEKLDGMVGTAVLVLPCAHIGGGLSVRQGEQQAHFASQQLDGGQDIRWFAFYADCRHEVLPVEEGWRVAITFDLVLPRNPADLPPLRPDLLAACSEFFGLGSEQQQRSRPWVLMLEHEYSEHGLHWPLLKGVDRARVSALCAVADELGLSVHLALAELHQSWTAEDPGAHRGRYRSSAPAEPEPGELIDESLVLDFWLGRQDSQGQRRSLTVRMDDCDCFTETGAAHLVNSEYEGYMGNYGETLDYWYRRAAVVLQTAQSAERSAFASDFKAALAALRQRARQAGDARRRQQLCASVRAQLDLLRQALRGPGHGLLAAYADIAAALDDAGLAMQLMADFELAGLLPADAAKLALLERAHGSAWLGELLAAWRDAPLQRGSGLVGLVGLNMASLASQALVVPWPAAPDDFIRACSKASLGAELLALLQTSFLARLCRMDAEQLAKAKPQQRQTLLPAWHAAVTQLASALRLSGAQAQLRLLLAHLPEWPALYPVRELAALAVAAGHKPLLREVRAALRAALAEPERAAQDQGLRGIEWQCRCQFCVPALAWAESADGAPLLLPLAEARRQHVQERMQAAGAGLRFEVVKVGSPYRLKLNKPTDLRQREQAQRQRWAADLTMVDAALAAS